jgi:hypothetical protein
MTLKREIFRQKTTQTKPRIKTGCPADFNMLENARNFFYFSNCFSQFLRHKVLHDCICEHLLTSIRSASDVLRVQSRNMNFLNCRD